MRKKVLSVAVLVICLSSLATATLAYFTDQDTARNVITSGAVKVAVVEQQQAAGSLVDYPAEPIVIMPGTTVSKIVTVKNQAARSFIRARLELTVKDSSGEVMEASFESLDDIITVTVNTDEWVQADGWWYYNRAVDTDQVTQPLMTSVIFDGSNMTNEYQSCTLEITVTAQAVQAANNASNALEALGWPEE